ncbi:MAG TPA: hypothetical protein PLG66_00210, partial [Calditrichia bacterium]|nr:hypothetical protein [Calditrichia bacterium]
IADVMEIATTTGLDASSKTDGTQQVSKTYDPATGIWTLTLERERGSTVGAAYAYIRRVYQYQFRNAQGQPQQYYITGADTAASISFDIVEGVGRHRNFRISQELTSLSGSFLATGTNTDWITLNGNYQRSAVDTLTTRQAVRTLDHSIALTLTDVRGPRGLRGSRGNISEMISGTISGTYTATATFTSGSGYRERNITRTFLIDLSNGTASMEVDGKTYVSDLESGELVENN